jgi:hypothetical protein
MRFQVPQFVEVEDKIFGPLTLKQFIYLAGGAGMCAICWFFLPKFIAIIAMAPIAIFSLTLAFYKPNNRPFIFFVESFFRYTIGSKLYIWKKHEKKIAISEEKREEDISDIYIPKLSGSKLKDLSWSLGVKESENPLSADTKLTTQPAFKQGGK